MLSACESEGNVERLRVPERTQRECIEREKEHRELGYFSVEGGGDCDC